MLNHQIRDLLFHYKKGVILLQFYLVRVMRLTSSRVIFIELCRRVRVSFQNPKFKILEGLNPEFRNTEIQKVS